MESRLDSAAEIWLNRELLRTMHDASDVKQKVADVFELLQDSVFRYLTRTLNDPSEAEDVMQETFIRFYHSLRKGQAIDDVRPWIFRVAHNLAIDRFRKRIPVDLLDTAGWDMLRERRGDPSPNAEQQVLEKERLQRIEASLVNLSPKEKHCLELRAEGLSYREIAQVLEMKRPTLVSFLGRIMKKLMNEAHD